MTQEDAPPGNQRKNAVIVEGSGMQVDGHRGSASSGAQVESGANAGVGGCGYSGA